MLRVRNVTEIDDFVDPTHDPDDYPATVQAMWEAGASRPDWCFVIEDDSKRLGRVGFGVAPTTSDPGWLGTLHPQELFVFGLHLPWDQDPTAVGIRLLAEAAAAIDEQVPPMLEVRIIDGVHDHVEARLHLAPGLGMELFAEKRGYQWIDEGQPIPHPDRLVLRSVSDIGVDAFREVMARCGSGTLDRNDRYYWQGCGPTNWAAQMTEYLDPDDAEMWLVGYDNDSPVGYVAVARDEDVVSTIAHIGIVPELRGNGYVNELLAAGTEAARRAGIPQMLSDVDVLNHPMASAMVRAGHLPDRRPWHVWAFRTNLDDLNPQRRQP